MKIIVINFRMIKNAGISLKINKFIKIYAIN